MNAFLLVFLFGNVAFGAKPSNVSVALDRALPSDGYDVYIGQSETFVMTAQLPAGTTSDMTIELFPSTKDTIFAFGELINHTVGADLTSVQFPNWFNDAVLTPGPEYTDTELGIYYNTIATFALGDIVNDGSLDTIEASTISIYFEIVYVDIGSNTAGDPFWVSCGLSFNSDIWNSHYSFFLRDLNPSHTNEASFELSPLPDFEDGGKIITTDLTMNISHGQASLNVQAYVLNETQSISPVKMEMTSVGGAYNYSFRPEKMQATRYEECFVKNTTNQLLSLDIGTAVNRESQKANPDVSRNILEMRISWLVFNTEALDKTYSLGVSVDVNGKSVYVITFHKLITARNPAASPLAMVTATSVGPNVVSAGTACSVGVVMDTPEGSLHTYNVTLTTRRVNANESKLMLLSYTSGDNGDNLPCPPEEIQALTLSKTDLSNPKVMNEGNITLAVLNTGLMSTNEQPFTVKMLAMPDAINNSVHELVVDINGVEVAAEYIITDPGSIDANFTASADGTDEVLAGGFATVKVVIHMLPETAKIYTVKLRTMEKNGTESQLSIVYHEFASSGGTKPYLVEDVVDLTLAKTDATNPYVNNAGNMMFTLVNTGLVTSNDLDFDVRMVASVDAVNGTVYEVVVDINGVQKIVEITVGLQKQLSTTFTATLLNTSVIEAGGLGKAVVTIVTTPESLQRFDMHLTTGETNGTASDLSIRSHMLVSSGQTTPAVIEGTEVVTLSDNLHVRNESNVTFTVLNTGTAASNETVIHVDLVAVSDAVNASTHELVVQINGVTEIVEITIEEQASFNTNVTYNVTMNVTSSSRLTPGDTFTVEATVNTIPDTVPGAMTIVLPEPLVPNTTPYVEFIEAETTSKGANVLFPLSGSLDLTMASWDDGSGDGKKAVITVPFVRNIQTATDDAENDWVIEFKFRLMNHTDLQTAEQQVTFGVTMNFTDNQFYDGTVDITSVPEIIASAPGQRSATGQQADAPLWWIGVGFGCLLVVGGAVAATAYVVIKKKNMNSISALKECKDN